MRSDPVVIYWMEWTQANKTAKWSTLKNIAFYHKANYQIVFVFIKQTWNNGRNRAAQNYTFAASLRKRDNALITITSLCVWESLKFFFIFSFFVLFSVLAIIYSASKYRTLMNKLLNLPQDITHHFFHWNFALLDLIKFLSSMV